ncbi:MAG: alpha/beta fold hydrolase [Planctomycetes bacterium]|nr:alpha/beta fold hydrolase [Planctomycetota bacterium]
MTSDPGTAMHVVERGAGSLSLIFLHYFAGSSKAWSEVVNRLASRYRCLVPDLPGFGDSLPTPHLRVDDYADALIGLLASQRVSRFLLIGHSMGGKIALAVAAQRPAALMGMVLLAPSPPTPEPIEDDARARALAAHGDRQEAEATFENISARPLSDAVRHQVVEDSMRSSPNAWHAWLASGSREDISSRLSGLRLPTVVLTGSEDRVLPPAVIEREVVGRIPAARHSVIPGAGHLLPYEASGEVAEAVSRLAEADTAMSSRLG